MGEVFPEAYPSRNKDALLSGLPGTGSGATINHLTIRVNQAKEQARIEMESCRLVLPPSTFSALERTITCKCWRKRQVRGELFVQTIMELYRNKQQQQQQRQIAGRCVYCGRKVYLFWQLWIDSYFPILTLFSRCENYKPSNRLLFSWLLVWRSLFWREGNCDEIILYQWGVSFNCVFTIIYIQTVNTVMMGAMSSIC